MNNRIINSYFGILNKVCSDENVVIYKSMKIPHPFKGFNKYLFPRQKTLIVLPIKDSDDIPDSYVDQYKQVSKQLTTWKTHIAEQIRDVLVIPTGRELSINEIFDSVVVDRIELNPGDITIIRLRFTNGMLHNLGYDLCFDPNEPKIFNGHKTEYR